MRFWGVPLGGLWVIRIVCFALSIALVSAVAARQFVAPIKQLAAAARQFGVDPQAPPIAEAGPQELRQVARTFNAMQAQIQTFIAHRTTMLAAISHDMRTPLTRIRLRGELIEDKEQQARLFRDVDEMQAMVDGALAFFRDDAIAEATTLRRVSWSRLELSRDADFECLRISHQSGSQSPPSRKSRTGGRGMEVG